MSVMKTSTTGKTSTVSIFHEYDVVMKTSTVSKILVKDGKNTTVRYR